MDCLRRSNRTRVRRPQTLVCKDRSQSKRDWGKVFTDCALMLWPNLYQSVIFIGGIFAKDIILTLLHVAISKTAKKNQSRKEAWRFSAKNR